MDSYDLIVVGGGMAGLPIANKGSYKGLRTALVEQEVLGGTCLNRGCIPTKTMLASARVAQIVRRASDFGVGTSGPTIDLAAVVARKDRVVSKIRSGAYRRVERNEHLTLIEGEATFAGSHRLRVGDRELQSERIVINTGARPTVPPVAGLADVPYLTNRSALELTEVPQSMLVIGGGYVGVEFAQMYGRFGSSVTVVQHAARLVPAMEPEIGEVLAGAFTDEGITVRTSTTAERVTATPGGVILTVRTGGATEQLEAERLLLAAGRTPNTEGLNLGATGVMTDAGGFVTVDHQFRTSAAGIWAIGDVTGPPMFTHSARDDAELLYRLIVKGDTEPTTAGRVVPSAVFTDPEIGTVGLTEAEARAAGHDVLVGREEFRRVARAMALGETAGFLKVIADADTRQILGAHLVGPHAGELIHEFVIAMTVGATYDQLGRALHIHPTLAEGVSAAAGGVHRPAG